MRTGDVLGIVTVLLVVCALAGILARQRFMLRGPGGVALAVRAPGGRWQYGIGRFVGNDLQWFRAFGFGTRPTRVLHRMDLNVVGRTNPTDSDIAHLPQGAVIVECTDTHGPVTLAFGEGAYTGFVSWLESSAPSF